MSEDSSEGWGAVRTVAVSDGDAAQEGQRGGDANVLVGQSVALRRVLLRAGPVGRSLAPVLIRGESGTGKELLARVLHLESPRHDAPFVKVNCAAMVDTLLLSELFGHERGAFTGATHTRKGRFELADGGTLFLDEVGDLSPSAQRALLRVLQEQTFERVGGTQTIRVDVRVVCATHRDLEASLAAGTFREDLYYRLKGVMLELPPLRAREGDVRVLVDAFLKRLAGERGEPVRSFSSEAMAVLERHTWPGNVRELENVVSAALIFADSDVMGPEVFAHAETLQGQGADDDSQEVALDYYALARRRGLSLKDLRQEVEAQCIASALREASGNISEAARLLKVKRSRLSQIVNANGALSRLAHGTP